MSSVSLNIDVSDVRPLNKPWSFGANTCHAPLWMRDDLQEHLRLAHEHLGFRHVRAHDIFSGRFDIIQPDGSFCFDNVILALQKIVNLGYTPFVELSSMPEAMCLHDTHITAYKFRTSPPRDWSQWYQLVHGLVRACAAHFGHDAVTQWHFEVWNEPDIDFWSGTQAEYFKLYDFAAQAVKEVNARFRIGGPATSKTAWIQEFLEHVTAPSPDFSLKGVSRCDFISTHAYPSDLAYLDEAQGEVKLQNSNIMAALFQEVRRKTDAVFGADFPLYCGEWNSSAGPLARNHDECNNGPFAAKTMIEMCDVIQGSLWWNLSDIYEECGFHDEPFHGGYGLLTVDNLPKAAFHAFRLLNEHQGNRIVVVSSHPSCGLSTLVSHDENKLRVLLAYYQEPDEKPFAPLTVEFQGLPSVATQVEYIEPGAGSAYEIWRDMGCPETLDETQTKALQQASCPRVVNNFAANSIQISPGTLVQMTFELSSH